MAAAFTVILSKKAGSRLTDLADLAANGNIVPNGWVISGWAENIGAPVTDMWAAFLWMFAKNFLLRQRITPWFVLAFDSNSNNRFPDLRSSSSTPPNQ